MKNRVKEITFIYDEKNMHVSEIALDYIKKFRDDLFDLSVETIGRLDKEETVLLRVIHEVYGKHDGSYESMLEILSQKGFLIKNFSYEITLLYKKINEDLQAHLVLPKVYSDKLNPIKKYSAFKIYKSVFIDRTFKLSECKLDILKARDLQLVELVNKLYDNTIEEVPYIDCESFKYLKHNLGIIKSEKKFANIRKINEMIVKHILDNEECLSMTDSVKLLFLRGFTYKRLDVEQINTLNDIYKKRGLINEIIANQEDLNKVNNTIKKLEKRYDNNDMAAYKI